MKQDDDLAMTPSNPALQTPAATREVLARLLHELHSVKELQEIQAKRLLVIEDTLDGIDREIWEHNYAGPLFIEDPEHKGKLIPYEPKPEVSQANGA